MFIVQQCAAHLFEAKQNSPSALALLVKKISFKLLDLKILRAIGQSM